MAGFKGSKVLIKKAGAVICAGIQSKDIKFNGEPIDISGDDDNGFRKFLDEPGILSIDIGFEGVVKDKVIRDIIVSGNRMLTDVTLFYDGIGTFSCDWYLANFSEKGESNDAMKFSCELQSSGEYSYVAVVS